MTKPVADDQLGVLIKQFQAAADSSEAHRLEAEQARDYYDGKQWTAAERSVLQKRKQPIITDNRIADKVQYLLGMERKTRTDPKAYPRNPSDEGGAEAATDALRYIFDCNDFQQIRSLVAENMFVEGVGVAEVVRDGKKDKIRRVRWDRFYADPHSMELDYSDALYMGIVAWFDQAKLIQKYPKLKSEIEGGMTEAARTYVDTYDDKPDNKRFFDIKRRRIQVFEHYYWDKGWKRAVFMKGTYLEPPAPSPYTDEDGVPECPIIAQAAFRDRDGNPYGLVRRYKDLQDEINKRRSKALHLLSTNRLLTEKGAAGSEAGDKEKLRNEIHRPDGIIEVVPGMRADLLSNTEMGNSQFNLLADAMNALANTGPNQALQGNSGQMSGRAKQLDQEGGAIQIGPLFDQIRHFQKRVARACWNRVRQFWNEETWIRVTDDEQKLKFVGLNVPISQGEMQVQQMMQQGMPPEQMQAAIMQIGMDPMAQVPAARKNDVTTMHVDIVIDESPDTVVIQQEQFEQLVQLVSSGAIPPSPNLFEVLVEASGLRNKQKVLEKLKSGGEDPAQQQAMQQAQAQQQAMAEADVRKKQADASKSEADAVKTQVETAVMLDGGMRPDMSALPQFGMQDDGEAQ